MRVTAISAYVPSRHFEQGRRLQTIEPRQKVTVPVLPVLDASPVDIARMSGKGMIVNVLC